MICIKFETTEILKILHFYRHWQTTAFGFDKTLQRDADYLFTYSGRHVASLYTGNRLVHVTPFQDQNMY